MNDLSSPAPEVASGPPRWMMSFADLMSVVLTFFVLIFSMSVPPSATDPLGNDLKKTADAEFSLHKGINDNDIKMAKTDQDTSTNYLADVIKNRMATYPELSKAELKASVDKLTLAISSNEFSDEYAQNLAQMLKSLPNKVSVYSSALDESKTVAGKLQKSGLERNILYLESHDMPGKIDIVIYP